MSAKFRLKNLKWILPLGAALVLALWWYSWPSARVEPKMVLIPAGDFQMGNPSMPMIGVIDEFPSHTVRLTAFLIGNYEVTKFEWATVQDWGKQHGFNDLPYGDGKEPEHPVCGVNWYDVVKWCNARSIKEGLKPCYSFEGKIYQNGEGESITCDWSTNGYRLPTEAEWEKAARGGMVGKDYPWGNFISQSRANYCEDEEEPSKLSKLWVHMMDRIAPSRVRSARGRAHYHPTYETQYSPYTSSFASFPANGYGLHDMAGNVSEWCWDGYGAYLSSPQNDPRGAVSGLYRVARGGSWAGSRSDARCASRHDSGRPDRTDSGTGFRYARSSVP
jgi:sulfatase modifying factor 1